MKAYLILDNGFTIHGTLFGNAQNILGELNVSSDGTFMLHNVGSSKDCVLTENSATLKEGHSVFFSKDIEDASNMLKDVIPTYAKLVIDDMSVDYHLYDLKTYIPNVGLNVNKIKNEKAAA